MQGLHTLINAYNALSQNSKDALTAFRLSDDRQGDCAFAYNLNIAMRTSSIPAKWQTFVNDINAAFATSRLSHPATVYRAVEDVSHLGTLQVGNTWTSGSFVSTSMSWVNLHTHLKSALSGATGAVLTIRLPAGTPAVYLGTNASSSSETEILLQPGDRFKMCGVSDGDIGYYVTGPAAKRFAHFKEIILQRC